MSDIAIRVEKLGKRYRIGKRENGSNGKTPLLQKALAPFGYLASTLREPTPEETLWALRDVSFEVKRGEVVGIIGKNGAGKSTLLKILTRITEPTEGWADLYGRVGSLLEVGTGFHPELTGRENIYLSGTILGMKRWEIDRRLDEIVAFSEIEKFLDTPVKRYSSGMYVRLAFAVAAHLESEILIVDEVLAVGDIYFQKKCLGKIGEVAQEGRTVLLVSHNMGTVTSLSTRAILLNAGGIVKVGLPSDVVLEYYTNGHISPAMLDYSATTKRIGDNFAELKAGYIRNSRSEYTTEIDIREPFTIGMRYRILERTSFQSFSTYPQVNLYGPDGNTILNSMAPNTRVTELMPGEYEAECDFPGHFLNNDTYFVGLALATCDKIFHLHFFERNALSFHVRERVEDTILETRNGYAGVIPGVIRPKLKWHIRKL